MKETGTDNEINKKIDFSYTVKTSLRAKRLRLTVYRDGRVVVTIPRRAHARVAERFVMHKSDWILKKISQFKKLSENSKFSKKPDDNPTKKIPIKTPTQRRVEFLKYKKEARTLVQHKLEHFNRLYNFTYHRIAIKNQKTRWGSCSSKGNLNFNYRIALIPEHLADYIVVHELCHLGQFNHSQKFWDLVARTLPHYKKARTELKHWGLELS